MPYLWSNGRYLPVSPLLRVPSCNSARSLMCESIRLRMLDGQSGFPSVLTPTQTLTLTLTSTGP